MWTRWIYWFGGWFFDFTKAVTFVAFALVLCHFFVATVLVVKGASMEQTYKTGDVLIIEKFSYLFDKPQHGDIVGIYFPTQEARRIIKRVIAIPGDKVAIKDGAVLINEKPIDESYLTFGTKSFPEMTYTLKSDEYFVMGDNRGNSLDSRMFGPLPSSAIIGKKLFFIANFSSLWSGIFGK